MQRLRQQRNVDAGVPNRQLLELAAFPDHVRHVPTLCEPPRAPEHDVRSIHGDDPRGPARRLDREIALAAAEIGDLERRQQQTQRPRPRRPAAAGHELPRVARIGAAVRLEVLFAQPEHLLEARFVGAHGRIGRRLPELHLEHRPERRPAVHAVANRGRDAVVGEACVLLLDDQTGLLEQAQVARDTRLGEAEDAGELGDVQTLGREDPQEAEPRLVAQQAIQRRGVFHITKST